MNGLRILQVATVLLLASSAFTALSWYEQRGSELTEVGRETLSLSLEAPVARPVGPWDEGTVFTEESAGIPLSVAPVVTVKARYHADELIPSEHQWSAKLTLRHHGDGARLWWRTELPIAMEVNGTTAAAALNLSQLVNRATVLHNQSNVPGRLDLVLTVTRDGASLLGDEWRQGSLTAIARLVPQEGYVVPEVRSDEQAYERSMSSEPPLLPALLAFGALCTGASALLARRRLPPWENGWGVTTLEVEDLFPSPGSPKARLDALLAVARATGDPVLLDRVAGWAGIQGPRELYARLPEDWCIVQDPEPKDSSLQGHRTPRTARHTLWNRWSGRVWRSRKPEEYDR